MDTVRPTWMLNISQVKSSQVQSIYLPSKQEGARRYRGSIQGVLHSHEPSRLQMVNLPALVQNGGCGNERPTQRSEI